MATASQNLPLWPEEDPVGAVINNTPAHPSPRPVLRLFRDGLSPDLDPTGALRRQVLSARDLLPKKKHQRGSAHSPSAESAALPTALPAFDQLLAGGLDRGRLVELVGRRSSGRLSAVLATLAAATACGEASALVDLGDGLDPRTAHAAGIDLERLLWVRPRRVSEALRAAELLLTTGFPLVVVELGAPPLAGGRGGEAFWLRLARAARERGAALLVSAPYRVSGTAATAVLQAWKLRPHWVGNGAAPRLLMGAEGRIELQKHRQQRPGATAPLPLLSTEQHQVVGTHHGSKTPSGSAGDPQRSPEADGKDGEWTKVAAPTRRRVARLDDGSTPQGPEPEGRSWGSPVRTEATPARNKNPVATTG